MKRWRNLLCDVYEEQAIRDISSLLQSLIFTIGFGYVGEADRTEDTITFKITREKKDELDFGLLKQLIKSDLKNNIHIKKVGVQNSILVVVCKRPHYTNEDITNLI